MILLLLFTDDVTICMKIDPGIYRYAFDFLSKTGYDMNRSQFHNPGGQRQVRASDKGTNRNSGLTGPLEFGVES